MATDTSPTPSRASSPNYGPWVPIESPTIEKKVFWARGFEPDVRLHVLERAVYHVHSVVLKLYSNFFFEFLDSAEKQDAADKKAAVAQGEGGAVLWPLSYDWITLVDTDGTWSLIGSMDGKTEAQNMDRFKGNAEDQLVAFNGFIASLYQQRYDVQTIKQLQILVDIAGYYRALPVVSRNCHALIHPDRIRNGQWDLNENCITLMKIAKKLRMKDLFQDMVKYLANKRQDWRTRKPFNAFEDHLDPETARLVIEVSLRVDNMVAIVFSNIIELQRTSEFFSGIMQQLATRRFVSMPGYFRFLFTTEWVDERNNTGKVFDSLRALMYNELTLFPGLDPAGTGSNLSNYQCAWMLAHEVQWDEDEVDW